jgi:hypothetical protein
MHVSINIGEDVVTSMNIDFSSMNIIVNFGIYLSVHLSLDGQINVYKGGTLVCTLFYENGEIKERRVENGYTSLAMRAAVTARPMLKALRELRVGIERMERIAEQVAIEESEYRCPCCGAPDTIRYDFEVYKDDVKVKEDFVHVTLMGGEEEAWDEARKRYPGCGFIFQN